MRKTRGFRLGRKLLGFWRRVLKPKCKSSGYIRLNDQDHGKSKTMTKICNWGRCLTRRLCSSNRSKRQDYSRLDQNRFESKPVSVPKGHLAVYVGEKDDFPHRFLVPVIYFNHPLFGQLLKEAEEEYGYHHTGGITIPCRISDFENVQTKIAGDSCRKLATKSRLHR